jgi:hypothetical protein
MMAIPNDASPDQGTLAHARSCAMVRLLFGTLQTIGSTAGFILLIRTGVNRTSVTVIGVTAGITILSRLTFRKSDPH